MHAVRLNVTFLLAGALVAAGCGDDDGGGAGADQAVLAYDLDGVPPLGDGWVYEGWLIVDGGPVSTGRFDVDATGATSPATFAVDLADLDAATRFVLTIEPAVGDDPAPADAKLLAGPIAADEAALTVSDEAAIGTDFADATGELILATPTSAAMDDEGQGLWWLVPPATMGGAPTAGLSLPTLPAGWIYEGWIATADGPVSTGTFAAPVGADSDGAGPAAGTDAAAPPFPGQDFVDPARDLTSGTMAVISVEPVPDDSPMPFQIKPIAGPLDATLAPATQSIPNDGGASLPTGAATFARP